jgi:hypothetical protein
MTSSIKTKFQTVSTRIQLVLGSALLMGLTAGISAGAQASALSRPAPTPVPVPQPITNPGCGVCGGTTLDGTQVVCPNYCIVFND